jgi:hypothetical protein
MSTKFKVGDKVIGNQRANNTYSITQEGYIAKVIDTREYCGVPQIHIEQNSSADFWVDEDCFDLYSKSKTNEEITEVTVDVEFVKQAHAEACSDWKQKIEKKFPDLFESPAGKALKEFGKEYVCDPKYKILVFEDHLFVPLPNQFANNEWTFEAFEFAKDFIKKIRALTYVLMRSHCLKS